MNKFKRAINIVLITSLISSCYSFKRNHRNQYKEGSIILKERSRGIKITGKQVYKKDTLEIRVEGDTLEREAEKEEIKIKPFGRLSLFDNQFNYSLQSQFMKKKEKEKITYDINLNLKQKFLDLFSISGSYSFFDIRKNDVSNSSENGKTYMTQNNLNLRCGGNNFYMEGFTGKEKRIDYEEDIQKEFKTVYGLRIKKHLGGFDIIGTYRYLKQLGEQNIDVELKSGF